MNIETAIEELKVIRLQTRELLDRTDKTSSNQAHYENHIKAIDKVIEVCQNDRIKELIEDYKNYESQGNPKCSTWNVIKDLESLLEPDCQHKNTKMVRNEKYSDSNTIYNTDECIDCGAKIRTEY